MWKPGDVIAWRGIVNGHPWHVQAAVVVQDRPDELVIAFLPGAEAVSEKTYAQSNGKARSRVWEFEENKWELARYVWHTHRVLAIVQPETYHSIMYFWHQDLDEFRGYYVNFQLPFTRSHCGINTRDLELDIDIEPDLNFRWKDEEDYQEAIKHGSILPTWVRAIEEETPSILDKLEKRQYPFDGAWLDWRPDPSWSPPTLPQNWDKI